jgi:transposase-like protein
MCVVREGLGHAEIRSTTMKKRVRQCDQEKQRHWEAILAGWKESGRSVRDFCQAEGLRESAFYFWRRELARRSQTPNADHPPVPEALPSLPAPQFDAAPPGATPRSRPRRDSASFLPVRIVQDVAAEATGGIEIVLACGRRVCVAAGFDRQTLRNVLAVLEARPC